MFKKVVLIILTSLTTGLLTNAQSRSVKDFYGRWRTAYTDGKMNDIQFLTDSTGAFLSSTGLLQSYFNYSADFKKSTTEFKYTIDIHRAKNRIYNSLDIKFINDTTFLLKFRGYFPERVDTNTQKLVIYRRLKTVPPGTELRFPTYHDLIGSWSANLSRINTEKVDNHIVFIDENHAWFRLRGVRKDVSYTVDFTVQPIIIDFYNSIDHKLLPAFLRFDTLHNGTDVLWIEFFPKNNRGDHFQFFGQNGVFKKVKAEGEK